MASCRYEFPQALWRAAGRRTDLHRACNSIWTGSAKGMGDAPAFTESSARPCGKLGCHAAVLPHAAEPGTARLREAGLGNGQRVRTAHTGVRLDADRR